MISPHQSLIVANRYVVFSENKPAALTADKK
jgi:hypothetical protein